MNRDTDMDWHKNRDRDTDTERVRNRKYGREQGTQTGTRAQTRTGTETLTGTGMSYWMLTPARNNNHDLDKIEYTPWRSLTTRQIFLLWGFHVILLPWSSSVNDCKWCVYCSLLCVDRCTQGIGMRDLTRPTNEESTFYSKCLFNGSNRPKKDVVS
jgi:hypothetical protein